MSLKNFENSYQPISVPGSVSLPTENVEDIADVFLKDNEHPDNINRNITGHVNVDTGTPTKGETRLEGSEGSETTDKTANTATENTDQSPVDGRKADTEAGGEDIKVSDRPAPLGKQWERLPERRNNPCTETDTDSSLQSPGNTETGKSVSTKLKDLDVVTKSDCKTAQNTQISVYKNLPYTDSNIKSIVNKYNTMATNITTPGDTEMCKTKPIKLSPSEGPLASISGVKDRSKLTYKKANGKLCVSSYKQGGCSKILGTTTSNKEIMGSQAHANLNPPSHSENLCKSLKTGDRMTWCNNSQCCCSMGDSSNVGGNSSMHEETDQRKVLEEVSFRRNGKKSRAETEEVFDPNNIDSPSECNSVMFGSTLDSLEDAFSLEFMESDADDELSGQEYYETVSPASPASEDEEEVGRGEIYDNDCKQMWESLNAGRNDYKLMTGSGMQTHRNTFSVPNLNIQNEVMPVSCMSGDVIGKNQVKKANAIGRCTSNICEKDPGDSELPMTGSHGDLTVDIPKIRDIECRYAQLNEGSESSWDKPGSDHGSSSDLVEFIPVYAHEEIRSIESSSVYEEVLSGPLIKSPRSPRYSCVSRYLSDEDSCSNFQSETQEGFESALEIADHDSDRCESDESLTSLFEHNSHIPDIKHAPDSSQNNEVLTDKGALIIDDSMSCFSELNNLKNDYEKCQRDENDQNTVPTCQSNLGNQNSNNANIVPTKLNAHENISKELQQEHNNPGDLIKTGNASTFMENCSSLLKVLESHGTNNISNTEKRNTEYGKEQQPTQGKYKLHGFKNDVDGNVRETKLISSDYVGQSPECFNMPQNIAITIEDNTHCSATSQVSPLSKDRIEGKPCLVTRDPTAEVEPNSTGDDSYSRSCNNSETSKPDSYPLDTLIQPLVSLDEHYFDNFEDLAEDKGSKNYTVCEDMGENEGDLARKPQELNIVEISSSSMEKEVNEGADLPAAEYSGINKKYCEEVADVLIVSNEIGGELLDTPTPADSNIVESLDVLIVEDDIDVGVDDPLQLKGLSDVSPLTDVNDVYITYPLSVKDLSDVELSDAPTIKSDVEITEVLTVSSDEEEDKELGYKNICCPEFFELRKRVRKLKRAMQQLSDQVFIEKYQLEQEVDQCRRVQVTEQSHPSLFERKLAELERERWLGQKDAWTKKQECIRRLKEADEICTQEIGQMNEAEERLRHLRRITDVWSKTHLVMPYFDPPWLHFNPLSDIPEKTEPPPDKQYRNTLYDGPISFTPQMLDKLTRIRDQLKANSLTGKLPQNWSFPGNPETLEADICKHLKNVKHDAGDLPNNWSFSGDPETLETNICKHLKNIKHDVGEMPKNLSFTGDTKTLEDDIFKHLNDIKHDVGELPNNWSFTGDTETLEEDICKHLNDIKHNVGELSNNWSFTGDTDTLEEDICKQFNNIKHDVGVDEVSNLSPTTASTCCSTLEQ